MSNFIIDSSSINLSLSSLIEKTPWQVAIKNKNHQFVAISQMSAELIGHLDIASVMGLTDEYVNCPVAALYETFFAQDDAAFLQGEQTNIDICKYADDKVHVLLSTKKVIIDDNQESFLLVTVSEIPIKMLLRVFSNINRNLGDLKKEGGILLGSYPTEYPPIMDDDSLYKITNRQADCLFYLLRGCSIKGIAYYLNISYRTVEEHIDKLKVALNCYSKSQLIEKAFSLGFAHVIPRSLWSSF